jgi:hypothetical protein
MEKGKQRGWAHGVLVSSGNSCEQTRGSMERPISGNRSVGGYQAFSLYKGHCPK